MTKWSSRLRGRGRLWAFRLGGSLVPFLPDGLVEFLIGVISWGSWRVNAVGRAAVAANLQVVLHRAPRDHEVREVFRTAIANYFDLFRLPRLIGQDLLDRVEVEGWEHLTSALEGGRGALIASLHLGNLEAVGFAATARGVTVMLPVERLEPPAFLDYMIELRQRAGLVCEPVGQSALDRIRSTLATNAVVGIGVDRVTMGRGEIISFCGKPARLPIAAGMLALRTGAPLLPIANTRLPGRRYRCRIGPPIPVRRGGPDRDTPATVTERLLGQLETFLGENPTQWVVFRQIWRESPG